MRALLAGFDLVDSGLVIHMKIEEVARLDMDKMSYQQAYNTLADLKLNENEEAVVLMTMNILRTKINAINETLEGVEYD